MTVSILSDKIIQMKTAQSVFGIQIRLTSERWLHIVENHNELAGAVYNVLETISRPDFIVAGWQNELLASKKINKHYLVVVYREEKGKKDGFIITAFITSRIHQIRNRKQIWPRKS